MSRALLVARREMYAYLRSPLGAGIVAAVLASTLAALGYAFCSFHDVRLRFAELYPFWRGARLGLALKNLARSMVVTACALATQLSQHGIIFAL